MNYNHRLGYIPGYDALIRYRTAQEKQKDWAKNVGRKGRRIAYATDRFDFGSSAYERKAMNQVYNASIASIGYSRLPFR